jgi:3-isopropylmalate/(R)-2-methylmalate dehydratase small subunit
MHVDTDQIMPKQWLKRIERMGYEKYVFSDWRLNADGSPKADFEMNAPRYAGASILLALDNFGCGSSREHAPWALENYGFRVLIAPSFADIFYNNCFKNGLLPIRLSEAQVEELFQRVASHPGYTLTADLQSGRLSDAFGLERTFEVDAFRRHCLLNGLDDIDLTLQHEEKITAYEQARGIARV